MTAFDRLVDKLRTDGHKVTHPRDGQAQAQCPAHDDRGPSLSVTRIEGQVLVYCHAGCPTDDVLAALKLTMADLFDEAKGASYRYDDGRVVHRSPDKRFRQSGRTTGTGQLYRLAEVVEAVANGVTIHIVEGEKDVHALEAVGQVATCSPMGAGKWHKADSSPLYGGNIVVVADKDGPGEKHARDIVDSLTGKVQSIRVVHAKIGKDAADHIAAGYGLDDLVPTSHKVDDEPAVRRARITWASDIQPRPVVWAWKEGDHGHIPAGSLSIAAGREGTGKSSFGMWQAANITRGLLPGSLHGKPGRVLYVAMEDSWAYTIVPRLIAAGADLGMVGRFDVVSIDDDEMTLSLPHDNDLLEKAIVEHGVKLVLIDPIMSVLGDSINASRSREVRRALDPLAKIADRTGCLIQGIAHFNKSSGGDPSSRIQESSAFKDVPRSVFTFAKDDDGRVMTQTKNSLGRDDLPSLTYVIEEAAVPTSEGMAFTGKFTFTGESERSVSDLLRDAGGNEDQTERDEAVEWLVDYITSNGGASNAGDAIKAAVAVGIAKTTLTRARQRANVRSEKSGMHGGWVWTIEPRRIHEEPEESTFGKMDSSVPSVDSSWLPCPECDHLQQQYDDSWRCWQHSEAS